MDPLVVLFGLGVGLLVGLTGIGGGSLMTPLLIIVAGYSPIVAIGTDLAYGAVTKTVGGWRVWKEGHVDLRLSSWMASGSMPGALLGVWAVDRLHDAYGDDFEPALLGAVAAALLLVACGVLFRAFFMPRHIAQERETADLAGRRRAMTVAIGFVLGFILGLTSVGSGALIGLALILVFKLTPHRVVGTDVFHAAILLWTAGIAHWIGGNVDFGLMGTILLGSLPGVWIGTGLLGKVPVDGLRPTLGVVLLAAALGVLTKAGVDLPIAAILGIPACVGVAAYLLHRARPRGEEMLAT
ncbi:MAG TPA: sulfite exporter TauE/SafE family protein [Solirubrobacteraceae bacterium]|jgi:hypothetical protein